MATKKTKRNIPHSSKKNKTARPQVSAVKSSVETKESDVIVQSEKKESVVSTKKTEPTPSRPSKPQPKKRKEGYSRSAKIITLSIIFIFVLTGLLGPLVF